MRGGLSVALLFTATALAWGQAAEKTAQPQLENCVGSNPGQVKARISLRSFRFELPKY